jgi:hypothetical protein
MFDFHCIAPSCIHETVFWPFLSNTISQMHQHIQITTPYWSYVATNFVTNINDWFFFVYADDEWLEYGSLMWIQQLEHLLSSTENLPLLKWESHSNVQVLHRDVSISQFTVAVFPTLACNFMNTHLFCIPSSYGELRNVFQFIHSIPVFKRLISLYWETFVMIYFQYQL